LENIKITLVETSAIYKVSLNSIWHVKSLALLTWVRPNEQVGDAIKLLCFNLNKSHSRAHLKHLFAQASW